MADRAFVGENLEVVAALERLVPEEMNFVVVLFRQEPETVSLVPAVREAAIEGTGERFDEVMMTMVVVVKGEQRS